MRTQPEISAEIANLVQMKPKVRRTSIFGDNHHKAIDAQILVLTQRMDESETYNMEWPNNVEDAAREAAQWLEGEIDEAPSEDWKGLLVN